LPPSGSEAVNPVAQVEEANVDREGTLIARQGVGLLPLRLERSSQPIEQADLGIVPPVQAVDRPSKHCLCNWRLSLLEKADSQGFRGAQSAFGSTQGLLDF
jgi:hypothetical protein